MKFDRLRNAEASDDPVPLRSSIGAPPIALLCHPVLLFLASLPEPIVGLAVAIAMSEQVGEDEPKREGRRYWPLVCLLAYLVQADDRLPDQMPFLEYHADSRSRLRAASVERIVNIVQERNHAMGIISAERIADIIEQAPAWSLIGLSVSKDPLRDAARHELAEHLYGALYRLPADDRDQLAFQL